MRYLIALAVVASIVPCAASAAEPECTPRVVDGYHLGMTRDEALAVRRADPKAASILEANEPGKARRTLQFDQSSHLASLDELLEDVDPSTVKASLSANWGTAKEVFEKDTVSGHEPRVIRAVWVDGGCGQTLEVLFNYGLQTSNARVLLKRNAQ